jgi:hypothetical protein
MIYKSTKDGKKEKKKKENGMIHRGQRKYYGRWSWLGWRDFNYQWLERGYYGYGKMVQPASLASR